MPPPGGLPPQYGSLQYPPMMAGPVPSQHMAPPPNFIPGPMPVYPTR